MGSANTNLQTDKIRVKGPDGNYYIFPKGMPVDQIHSAMAKQFPRDPKIIDTSKPLPYNVTKGKDTGSRLGNAWNSIKEGATKPLIPAEKWLRSAMPEGNTGPAGEAVAAPGIAVSRLIEQLSTPSTAAIGAAAGAAGSVGLPGYILNAGLSADMIRNAWKNAMADLPKGSLPRDKYANYITAALDTAMATMPFVPRRGAAVPKVANKKPVPVKEVPALEPAVKAGDLKKVPAPAKHPAPAPPAAEPTMESREPWYVKAAREEQARKAAEPAPAPEASSPLPEIPMWTGNKVVGKMGNVNPEGGIPDTPLPRPSDPLGVLPETSSPLPRTPMGPAAERILSGRGRIPMPEQPSSQLDPDLINYLQGMERSSRGAEEGALTPELMEMIGGEITKPAKAPKGSNPAFIDVSPEESLMSVIRRLGGISPEKEMRAGTLTELREGIRPGQYRQVMRKSSGNTMDDLLSQLASEGFNFESASQLMEALNNPAMRSKYRISTEDMAKAYTPEEIVKTPEGWADYFKMGVREPGQEGFADIEAKPLGDFMDSWLLRHPKGGNMEVRFGDQGAYVDQVRVPPEMRGQGHGSDLYTHLGEMMKQRGIPGSAIEGNIQGDPNIVAKMRARAAAAAGEGSPTGERFEVMGDEDPNDFMRRMFGEEGFARITPDEAIKKGWLHPSDVSNYNRADKVTNRMNKYFKWDEWPEGMSIEPKKRPFGHAAFGLFYGRNEKTPDARISLQFRHKNPADKSFYGEQAREWWKQPLPDNQIVKTLGHEIAHSWEPSHNRRFKATEKEMTKLTDMLWKRYGDEGFADTKKDQGGFNFVPMSIPGQKPEQSIGDLYNQILQAPDAAISKRDLLGINKKKKSAQLETPLFKNDTLF